MLSFVKIAKKQVNLLPLGALYPWSFKEKKACPKNTKQNTLRLSNPDKRCYGSHTLDMLKLKMTTEL